MIPAANAAATWWANKVCSPTFDNGDHSDAGGFTRMLAIQKMIQALEPKIEEVLTRMGDYGMTLGVDYGPDPILGDAARAADISTSKFPLKTMMWIYKDYVTVSSGYRGRTVLVWASEKWLANRPVCTSQKYDESRARKDHDYHGDPWSCSLPVYHSEDCKYDQPLELCKTCDHPKDFWHDKKRRSYSTDFHKFVK